ncbi:hypothetical protein GOZ83_28190 [Agrobacterium vitis]|uniref:hypothetical protein n=1 Tax=Rhizobium/Agrobacterium group TaxID=227290 RepID=UPI0012E74BE5|nr:MULTISPECIES: hypothetical protein [Rhizobium/Agrobacterium group]MCF1450565.1 hypothetical protein [Allorhizobium ampelinum]MCF1496188.1 hypothetical protein [Allorhizobium ampelinum]MVA48894.1 hypothetical protein [Agrobacterium vitis]
MDNSERRTRFETRIKVEREFLSVVNAVFGDDCPLSGMTVDAINHWRRRALDISNSDEVKNVARLLFEASSRADLMADNSKDVFEPDRRELNSLAEVHDLLVGELGIIKVSRN